MSYPPLPNGPALPQHPGPPETYAPLDWRRPRRWSVPQVLCAWLIWPVTAVLPVVLFLTHLATNSIGWMLLFVYPVLVPVLWCYGALLAVLVTLRAVRVAPVAAGPWTTWLTIGFWLGVSLFFLGTGDVGDSPETSAASPLEMWGWPGALADQLGMTGFEVAVLCAPLAVVAGVVEICLAWKPPRAAGPRWRGLASALRHRWTLQYPGRSRPGSSGGDTVRPPGDDPGRSGGVRPHAAGGRSIPTAGTVPRQGTGPRGTNPKRE